VCVKSGDENDDEDSMAATIRVRVTVRVNLNLTLTLAITLTEEDDGAIDCTALCNFYCVVNILHNLSLLRRQFFGKLNTFPFHQDYALQHHCDCLGRKISTLQNPELN